MGKNARLRQGLRRIFPAGITRRTFRSVIGFGMVFLIAITVVLTLISSQYLSQNLQEQLESQARRLKKLFGAPAAPGCCCECEGEPKDETKV